MFCQKCGNQLNEKHSFCTSCGNPIVRTSVNQPVQQPTSIEKPQLKVAQVQGLNFDVSNTDAVPFAVTEKDIRESFLDWVIVGDNTPIDIACNAVITEIKKFYYPVRYFDVTYSADWSATSIWEHREEYTEYEIKTVYFDMNGKEHNNPGEDYTDRSGHSSSRFSSGAIRRPWRPQQKNVPIIKHKMEIDNVEQTYGGIEKQKSFQPIATYNNSIGADFAKWIVDFPIKGHKHITNELLANCVIIPLIETDKFARNEAESIVKKIAINQCKQQIPGNRYEDLSIFNFDASYNMQIILLPVYEILYKYRGKEFSCRFSGITKGNSIYANKPEDSAIAQQNGRTENEIKVQKKKRLISGLISFLAVPFVCMFVVLPVMILDLLLGLLLLAIAVIFEIICVIKFLSHNKKVKNNKQMQKNYLENLSEKRRSIAFIVKNHNLPEGEKRKLIQHILNKV